MNGAPGRALAGSSGGAGERSGGHAALGNPIRSIAGPLEEKLVAQASQVVIPPRRNRKAPRSDDTELCKERNRIERLSANLKPSEGTPHAGTN